MKEFKIGDKVKVYGSSQTAASQNLDGEIATISGLCYKDCEKMKGKFVNVDFLFS